MCNLQGIETYRSQRISNPIVSHELDEYDRKDLSAKVSELTKKIKRQFRKFQNWVLSSIKADNVDRDILIATFKDDIQFTEEEMRTLTKSEVIMKVIYHSSYLNYDLLEIVVDTLDLDRGPLEEYLSAYSNFCAVTPCVEADCGSVESSATPGRYKVTFKVDANLEWNKLSLKDVELIRRNIAKFLSIKTSALYLQSVEEGCVLLTFLVPDFIIKRVFPLSDEQVKALYAELNVVLITIHYPSGIQVNTS